MCIYLLLILLGGIVALDTTAGPQILISEPIVSCTLLGILFSYPGTGVLIGILYQLLWLGYLPLGGTAFTDNNLAAFVSTASYFTARNVFNLSGAAERAALIPMMLIAAAVGYLGLRLHVYEQRINGKRNDMCLKRFEDGGTLSVGRLHGAGIATAYAKGALVTAVTVPPGMLFCGAVTALPSWGFEGISHASAVITGLAAASAILFYRLKDKNVSLIFGALCGCIWILLVLTTG